MKWIEPRLTSFCDESSAGLGCLEAESDFSLLFGETSNGQMEDNRAIRPDIGLIFVRVVFSFLPPSCSLSCSLSKALGSFATS